MCVYTVGIYGFTEYREMFFFLLFKLDVTYLQHALRQNNVISNDF